MNYIEQINVFWLLDAEYNFSPNETRLYFYLLKLSNSLGWKNAFNNADGFTATMVGVSVNTLKTSRQRLKDAGLIDFKPGGLGSGNKCIYLLIKSDKVIEKVSKNTHLVDTFSEETLTPFQQDCLQKVDDNTKLNINQTKLNNNASNEAGENENLGSANTPGITEKKEERKKVAPKKKEEPATPHWNALVAIWFGFYEEKYQSQPTFDGVAQKSLKAILKNLQARSEKAQHEWTEEKGKQTLLAFLTYAHKDSWRANHFTLQNLNSQFDIITQPNGQATAKNGTASNHGKPTAASVIAHLQKSYSAGGG